ncbi:MAG: hypothetical protein M4579_003951 [Chaenotheca gracillima]|nr:MAG: hypothetical protein M4579_003951 [Chaenotheca gracillima]
MSSLLWKFYLEDDADQFRRLLADARYVVGPHGSKNSAGASTNQAALSSSAGNTSHLASSPRMSGKHRKFAGWASTAPSGKGQSPWSNLVITRADVNLRDRNGLSILHHAASSSSSNAVLFATALLEHPLIDLYVQDRENGWTVLHRALYFGNVTIARAILHCDMRDAWGSKAVLGTHHAGGLIRIKDNEGNSPFDLLNASIASRSLEHRDIEKKPELEDDSASDVSSIRGNMDDDGDDSRARHAIPYRNLRGESLFTFGSNKNLNLGLGDEDDRQFPEHVFLCRPDHLLYRFYYEYQQSHQNGESEKQVEIQPAQGSSKVSSLPSLVQNRPLTILDVVMSKLHTAVLTDDPEANLYVCGFGSGGRLGTGDETTRFNLVSVQGGGLAGKRVVNVGLGQNHTLAITSEGEIFSWGQNTFGQLGYSLPKTTRKDDDPIQTSPRQIFGPLKREVVIGAAASRIHSVVHTSTALFTFGKNEGQLGLVDSDARSLEVQVTPRRVAASLFASPIEMIAAIDHATICLLSDHEVWVFANYGYAKLSFNMESFANYFLRGNAFTTRYDATANHVAKVVAGGDTICAMTKSGDVFTVTVSQKLDAAMTASSTTNPNKIRNALSTPQRIWSLRKDNMAVRDVDVGQDGSVIICTESGSVWRRVKRAKIKDPSTAPLAESKAKDYKFSRVPGLTRVIAVRSNTFGAYAAVRRDCDVTRTQILVNRPELWTSIAPLLSLNVLESIQDRSPGEDDTPRFWTPAIPRDHFDPIKRAVLTLPDLESQLEIMLSQKRNTDQTYDVEISTSVSDVVIPAHQFVLAGRSRVLRQGFLAFREEGTWSIAELLTIQRGSQGRPRIHFHGFDFLAVFDLIFYMYKDDVIDVWHFTRHAPKSAFRYRQVRTDLMKIASRLELRELEAGVRVMRDPTPCLDKDMEAAILDPLYLSDGDAVLELMDNQIKVHSTFMCQRCPFFEGLFKGRAAGQWLSSRRDMDLSSEGTTVDLKHVELSTFKLVLRHLYCDTGEELFDEIVTEDLDEFLDIVVDVLSVANELMLDRLSQICQKTLGRYVNTRNACQLLNVVSSCSVTEFKDACLEYLCLNLEAMLENHLLEELDDDLLLELDEVVRANQLACLPFAKSGRAEMLLQEKFPELAEERDLERQDRISAIAVRSKMAEEESRALPSRTKGASTESQSPASQKIRRKSSKEIGSQASASLPSLKSKVSAAELIFDMDEDDGRSGHPTADPSRPSPGPEVSTPTTPRLGPTQEHNYGPSSGQSHPSSFAHSVSPSQRREQPSWSSPSQNQNESPRSPSLSSSKPWASTSLSSSKLDMRDIMAQASSSRASTLSAGLSSQVGQQQRQQQPKPSPLSGAKLSQRERKKMRQQQQLQEQQQQSSPLSQGAASPLVTKETPKTASPWQVASSTSAAKVSLKEVLGSEERQQHRAPSSPVVTTTSITKPSPQTPQQRSVSNPTIPSKPKANVKSPTDSVTPSSPPPQPTITTHKQPSPIPASGSIGPEPSLNLSMADIISQQQAESDVIRQVATARRPLQDIQQEQEFMEWWDAESKKAVSMEKGGEVGVDVPAGAGKSGRGGLRGRGRGRGKKGESRGGGGSASPSVNGKGKSGGGSRGGGTGSKGAVRGDGGLATRGNRGGPAGGGERGGRMKSAP